MRPWRSLPIAALLFTAACGSSFEFSPPGGVAEWEEDYIPSGVETEEILALSGTAADDLWAVSSGHRIWHFDGRKWTDQRFQELRAGWRSIHAVAPNDVWTLGSSGYTGHFDGQEWTIEQPDSAKSGAVPGDSQALVEISEVMAWPGEVWISAGGGMRRANGEWLRIPRRGDRIALGRMWGVNAKDVWTSSESALAHFDGTRWDEVKPEGWREGNVYRVLHGSAANDVWFERGPAQGLSGAGAVLHYDGAKFVETPLPDGVKPGRLYALSPGKAWLTDIRGGLLKWDGKQWRWSPHGRRKWTFSAIYSPPGGKAVAAGFPGDRVLREK